MSKGLSIDDPSWLDDASPLVDRLDLLHRTLRPGAGHRSFELYHRAACSLRIGLRDGECITVRRGVDDGLALRSLSSDGREIAFAATSGSGKQSLQWVLARSRQSRGRAFPETAWARDGDRLKADHEAVLRLPSVDELTAWLVQARDELVGSTVGPRAGPEPLELWVEAAATAESWVADGGLKALRTRARGWGMLRLRKPAGAGSSTRPVLIARRNWADLPIGGWKAVLEDRRLSGSRVAGPPAQRVPILFSPECSAILVMALVKALHSGESEPRFPVGPAWNVVDDPGHATALFGGGFDDAGFATRRTLLADGLRATGSVGGEGHFRRPSFRDRPVPMPSHLVVQTAGSVPPSRAVLATALSLHPLDRDQWMLEIDGAYLEAGRPGPILRSAIVAVSPTELVRRCVAAVGPARLSHLGVKTPALVFDGLTLR